MDIINSIDLSTLNKIAEHYQLGKIISEPLQLNGGLLHQQWKLATNKGDFVIKQLNPTIITKPNAIDRYRVSEKIAKVYSNYINAVYAISVNNDPLFTVNNHTVMLFPHVDAILLNQNKIDMSHIIKISDVLITMHTSQIEIDNPPEIEEFSIDLTKLNGLTKKLQNIQPAISTQLQNAYPLIISIIDDYNQYKSLLLTNTIISHRDLDPKNVLWDKNNQYTIIDWESAGLIKRGIT